MNSSDKPNIFVIMPFANKFKEIYSDVIKPAMESNLINGYCYRVDDYDSSSGNITRDIVESIGKADVIIADLTSKNANVFYELGLAHCFGEKTIMIAQSTEDIPFDINTFSVVIYEQSIAGSKQLITKLQSSVVRVLAGQSIDNPVKATMGSFGGERASSLTLVHSTEKNVAKEVWIIGPHLQLDHMYFIDVMRENIREKNVKYRYILPDKKIVKDSFRDLRRSVSDGKRSIASRILSAFIPPEMIESEIVIYDPNTPSEIGYFMPPVENPNSYYQIIGSRLHEVKNRFEYLWTEASK